MRGTEEKQSYQGLRRSWFREGERHSRRGSLWLPLKNMGFLKFNESIHFISILHNTIYLDVLLPFFNIVLSSFSFIFAGLINY